MTKRKYKGIIFDLDGTLINTIEDLADSVNLALEAQGCPKHSVQTYKMFVGNGFRDLITKSLPTECKDENIIEKTLKSFVGIYDTHYLNKSLPYPGILDLLHKLAADGVPMAINSNKRGDYTTKMVNKLLPGIPFVAVFGERAGIAKKPDPSAALEIAQIMALEPADILYIGDSVVDIKTGKNGGMDTVGCCWGFRGEKELKESGATYLLETPDAWNRSRSIIV